VEVKKSSAVNFTVLPLLAVAFGACGEETAYCVDQGDRIVENRNCGDEDGGGSTGFFWIYGGSIAGNGKAVRGARIVGYDGKDKVVSTNKTVIKSRGGFGSGRSGGSEIGRSVSVSG